MWLWVFVPPEGSCSAPDPLFRSWPALSSWITHGRQTPSVLFWFGDPLATEMTYFEKLYQTVPHPADGTTFRKNNTFLWPSDKAESQNNEFIKLHIQVALFYIANVVIQCGYTIYLSKVSKYSPWCSKIYKITLFKSFVTQTSFGDLHNFGCLVSWLLYLQCVETLCRENLIYRCHYHIRKL